MFCSISGAIKECRIMKNVIPGEVYAIPLFLTDIHFTTRVSLKDLRGDDKKFAYCRIIEDRGSGGILVEVFNKVGTLDISIEEVVESMRLFPPVIITPLPIRKGRWRRIGKQENYNKEQDSMYSDITLVSGAEGHYFLWRGGHSLGRIPDEAIEPYEEWIYWLAPHLEERIIKALTEEGISF